MRTGMLATAFVALLASSASAGNGGKLPFDHDHKQAFESAKRMHRAAMVYFTASW